MNAPAEQPAEQPSAQPTATMTEPLEQRGQRLYQGRLRQLDRAKRQLKTGARSEARARDRGEAVPPQQSRWIGIADVQGILDCAGVSPELDVDLPGQVSIESVREAVAILERNPNLLQHGLVSSSASLVPAALTPRQTLCKELEALGIEHDPEDKLSVLAALLEDALADPFEEEQEEEEQEEEEQGEEEQGEESRLVKSVHQTSSEDLRIELKEVHGIDTADSLSHEQLKEMTQKERDAKAAGQ